MTDEVTYFEQRFEGSRTFTLSTDRIFVRGRTYLKSEFEGSIALRMLDDHPEKALIRSSSFTSGMWLAIIGVFGCALLIGSFNVSFSTAGPILLLGSGISGVLLMAATWRKVEFAQFKNESGIVVLTIARAGASAGDFESFVANVSRRIAAARGSS